MKAETAGASNADSAKKSERRIPVLPQSDGPAGHLAGAEEDQMGMDYVPVYADEEVGAQADKPKGKILYYR